MNGSAWYIAHTGVKEFRNNFIRVIPRKIENCENKIERNNFSLSPGPTPIGYKKMKAVYLKVPIITINEDIYKFKLSDL